MRTWLVLTIIVFAASASEILLKNAMKQVGAVSSFNIAKLFRTAAQVLKNRYFLASVFFMAISFFSFLAVLSWANMSLIVPATSLSYVVSAIGAKFILQEKISRLRLAGTVVVCLGVALISLP